MKSRQFASPGIGPIVFGFLGTVFWVLGGQYAFVAETAFQEMSGLFIILNGTVCFGFAAVLLSMTRTRRQIFYYEEHADADMDDAQE